MLILAHGGQVTGPHDLGWWSTPVAWALLVVAVVLWVAGARRGHPPEVHRWALGAGAVVALAVAASPPVERIAAELAAGHMVQHILLLAVAAPLLAVARPGPVWLRGMPRRLGGGLARAFARVPAGRVTARVTRTPLAAWLLLAASTWSWHAAGPYDAAVASPVLHALEHTMMLTTAWAFWRVAAGIGGAPHGVRLLLVATMGIATSMLAALMAFSTAPWYAAYLETAGRWGFSPLTDQQVAGAIMWVPTGAVHAAAALLILLGWLRSAEEDGAADDAAAGDAVLQQLQGVR